MQELIKRAKELLADGTVARVLGWKAGDLAFNPEPAYFETPESLEDFVYDGFCGANLSKYMIEASKLEGKTMVCLKPCDTYSFNQLLKEHRVDREKAYIVGVGCKGKLDIEKIRKMGIKGIRGISGAEITGDAETLTVDTVYGEKTCAYKDAMLERCHVCKGKEHKIYDELIGESKETKDADRFAEAFFPQSENLYTCKKGGKNISIEPQALKDQNFVVFGMRACDVQGVKVLDNVFLGDPVDTFYQARREHGTIVALACHEPEESCFCKVFGIDAADPEADVAAWIIEGELFWKPLTEKGNALTETVKELLADADETRVEE